MWIRPLIDLRNAFHGRHTIYFAVCSMNVEKTKMAIKAVTEAIKEKEELVIALSDTGCVASDVKKVFREGNKSKLIKLGVALIVFPEPSPVSEIVGAGFVAAGVVQKGIRNRAGFAEDVGRDLKKALKELALAKDQIRI